jgi:hypothetical protein
MIAIRVGHFYIPATAIMRLEPAPSGGWFLHLLDGSQLFLSSQYESETLKMLQYFKIEGY